MTSEKRGIGIAREGEKPRQGDRVSERESEVNENQSERTSKVGREKKESEGEREYVSDMNLSACVSLGRVSFHLSCALVMQIEKEVLI